MPRQRAPKITEVTDDLLAMRWDSDNSCRMWLRRRGTSVTALGLFVVPVADEGAQVRLARLPEEVAFDPADFERWATDVDTLLQQAAEPMEDEDALRGLFDLRMQPSAAFATIVRRRTDALSRTSVEAGRGPVSVMGGAYLDKATRDAIERDLAVPDVVRDTQVAVASSPHKDSAPAIEQPGYRVQLAGPMPLELAKERAAQVAHVVGVECLVLDLGGQTVLGVGPRAVVAPKGARR